MTKKIMTLALALVLALAAFPVNASATVLDGWTSKTDYENTDPSRYVVEIDLTNQVITVYNYVLGGTVAIQGLCTTGNEENRTGAGTYKLGDLRERFGYFVAFGQYAQYWTQVVRGVYIHSIMYDSTSLSSMSRSAYNNLGKAVSHGCVRVLPEVARFIYYNCPPGTTCKITYKTADAALVASVKSGMPSYSNYVQTTDSREWPADIPAVIRYDLTPLRTGFSTSKDTTVATLSRGDKVVLLQLGSDWCKVRTESGKLGYVKTVYLLADPDSDDVVVTAYTATKQTYVYASMSTDSKHLITIPGGGVMTVESNPKKGWWYGSFGGVSGYMRTKYVIKTTFANYPVLDEITSETAGVAIRSDISARMRAGAGSTYDVIAVLAANTPVTVISHTGAWYYCTAGGYTGYLHATCLNMG